MLLGIENNILSLFGDNAQDKVIPLPESDLGEEIKVSEAFPLVGPEL